ncbi:MAG: GH3 auxin-responsive promoter family protein [Flavobacteriales bacterium]|nr:GH3 auxin-responsive promoter family protein [Flavobacteriales bacterium]
MEIINSVFSWIIKKRIHQMELFMKHPIDVQNEVFLNLINTAKNTEWGRKYGYKSIKSYQDYINRVPLQDYESLRDQIIRIKHGEQNVLWPTDIKWFAKSSGTSTGKSKFIPVSKESLIDCHYKGGKDLLSIYHNNHPESKLILGKVLVVGGSGAINSFSNKSYYGDLSAIIMKNFPIWVEHRRVPKMSIAIMDNWEEKIEKMALSTTKENVSNISGVPSWTLVLMKRILEINKTDNILDIWPNLELFMHGGVNFAPYKEQFKKLAPGNQLNYYENYNATEGFFGLQDQSKVDEMLLMLDYGIFYEFIEQSEIHNENPKTITLESVELNKNYALVISTNAGLWRYIIGDTIKFTSLNPFRIKVSGRINQFINAFGEELIIDNAEKALSKACSKTHSVVKEYTVAPQFFTNKSTGKHQWLIEFEKPPENIEYFSKVLDDELKQLNSDYEAKRFNNMVLDKPEINKLAAGTFYHWMKNNNKLGGQHKIPRLSNNSKYIEELIKMA